jgi:hypothetical protein
MKKDEERRWKKCGTAAGEESEGFRDDGYLIDLIVVWCRRRHAATIRRETKKLGVCDPRHHSWILASVDIIKTWQGLLALPKAYTRPRASKSFLILLFPQK